MRDGKQLFYCQLEADTITDAYALAGEAMATKMCEAEAREGFSAFLRKELPPWRVSLGREEVE